MSHSANSEPLLVELDERGVLRLTMNRPEVHNAFDDHQVQRFIKALEEAKDNQAVRIVVIGGNGKSFSAGGDLNYMKRMGSNSYEDNIKDGGQLAKLMNLLNFFPKPTIARVQGAAYGGAVGLASCCDVAIASPAACFCLSEVKVGMLPATIAPYVVSAIGLRAARRYFVSAEVIRAEKALQLGLVSELVDADQLDTAIDALCNSILGNSPAAVVKAKQLAFDVSQEEISEPMITATIKLIADVRDSVEGREGLSAFLEKRKPSWLS